MKRIISVFLVVLILSCTSVAGARSRQTTAQTFMEDDKEMIERILYVHDNSPDYFSADHIYSLYARILSYYAVEDIFTSEVFLTLHSNPILGGKPFLTEDAKKLYSIRSLTYQTLSEAFAKWMSGESTDDEMMETLSFYGQMILEEQSTEETEEGT